MRSKAWASEGGPHHLRTLERQGTHANLLATCFFKIHRSWTSGNNRKASQCLKVTMNSFKTSPSVLQCQTWSTFLASRLQCPSSLNRLTTLHVVQGIVPTHSSPRRCKPDRDNLPTISTLSSLECIGLSDCHGNHLHKIYLVQSNQCQSTQRENVFYYYLCI